MSPHKLKDIKFSKTFATEQDAPHYWNGLTPEERGKILLKLLLSPRFKNMDWQSLPEEVRPKIQSHSRQDEPGIEFDGGSYDTINAQRRWQEGSKEQRKAWLNKTEFGGVGLNLLEFEELRDDIKGKLIPIILDTKQVPQDPEAPVQETRGEEDPAGNLKDEIINKKQMAGLPIHPELKAQHMSDARQMERDLGRMQTEAYTPSGKVVFRLDHNVHAKEDECDIHAGVEFDIDDPDRPQLPLHPNCGCFYEDPETGSKIQELSGESLREYAKFISMELKKITESAPPGRNVAVMAGVIKFAVEVNGVLPIEGVLAYAGVSHNRRLYLPEELARGDQAQLPLIFNHATPLGIDKEIHRLPADIQRRIQNGEKIILGQVTLIWKPDDLTLYYKGKVEHPFFQKEIREGRMSVSLGMLFEDSAPPVCDVECYTVVTRGIFQEVSLVYHPGFPIASIHVTEARLKGYATEAIAQSSKKYKINWESLILEEIGGAPPESYMPNMQTVQLDTLKHDDDEEKKREDKLKSIRFGHQKTNNPPTDFQ